MSQFFLLIGFLCLVVIACWVDAFVLSVIIARFGHRKLFLGLFIFLLFLIVTVWAVFAGHLAVNLFIALHAVVQFGLFWLLRKDLWVGVKNLRLSSKNSK